MLLSYYQLYLTKINSSIIFKDIFFFLLHVQCDYKQMEETKSKPSGLSPLESAYSRMFETTAGHGNKTFLIVNTTDMHKSRGRM